MRTDVALLPRAGHYHVMSGAGFSDIASYHARGGGWFGNFKHLVTRAASGAAQIAKKVGVDAAKSGVETLLKTGDPTSALMAAKDKARSGLEEEVISKARSALGGGMTSHARKRRRPY